MMARRRIWIFAVAALLPAVGLGFLALRSLRAEESIRRAETEDQAREFLKVASREIEQELKGRVLRPIQGTFKAPRTPRPWHEGPDLAESIRREQPDLLPLLHRAQSLEFEASNPAAAHAIHEELFDSIENHSTRGMLLFAAARCALKAGNRGVAESLFTRVVDEFPGVSSGSPLPLEISARLQLMAMGGDRQRLLSGMLSEPLELESQILLFRRLRDFGIDMGEHAEGARILLWARSQDFEPGSITWLPGEWAVWGVTWGPSGPEVRAFPTGPSQHLREKLSELARVANLEWGLRTGEKWLGPAGPPDGSEITFAGGALRVSAQSRGSPRSTAGYWAFVGLVLFLLASMAVGIIATLRAAQREMRLARLKSEFISGVSHELRTPLTSIRIFADLLSTPGPAEKREEHAAILKREAERLSGLVERVLDFARLERGGPAYRLEERDLAAVVDEAVRTFRAPRPGFAVTVIRDPEALTARVDALGVEQIIHNLLDNAAKYAPDLPAAEVVLRREGEKAVLEVRDRGPGIDPSDLPHVFETFFRGPGSSGTPGTGLGLAIVRQIAEAHGGSVRVASVPAGGATFSVEIPLCRASSS